MVGRGIVGAGVVAGTGAAAAGSGWTAVVTGVALGVEAVAGVERRVIGGAAFDFCAAAVRGAGAPFGWAFGGAFAGFCGVPASRGAGFEERLAFGVVVRPPGLECRFALRGDLLRIRRCRSISLIQV